MALEKDKKVNTAQEMYIASNSGLEEERERLRFFEQTWDTTTIRHLETLRLSPGSKCLNIGAGYGSITAWLAERVGSAGKVVATDIRPELHRPVKFPVEIRRHDILSDGLESDSFELVCCRVLLQHVPDPDLALANMIHAVKPGGWVLVEEFDSNSVQMVDRNSPYAQDFTNYGRETMKLFSEKTHMLDPIMARRLRSMFERSSLQDVTIEGCSFIVRGGEPWAKNIKMTYKAGWDQVKNIFPDEAIRLQALWQQVNKALEDPSFYFVSGTLFSAWGRKMRG
jgi:ubiquinone/menaquinone biosynthesis C-methylase UbiE